MNLIGAGHRFALILQPFRALRPEEHFGPHGATVAFRAGSALNERNIASLTMSACVFQGYGPATVPFIDAGQISLQDGHGNVEGISGMHPIPIIGLPPLNYRYAKAPGSPR